MSGLNELLQQRPVAAFNYNSADELSAILTAAKELQQPVICMISERAAKQGGLGWLLELFHAGKRYYGADCFVQFDHWPSARLRALKGLRARFDAILLDYSKSPHEVAPDVMARTVRELQAAGICVELEWEGISIGGDATYSSPEEAVQKHRLVPFDLWAAKIGTVHGLETKPEIDFARVQSITSGAPVPVVAHGCDLLDRDTLRRLSGAGVRKFNFGPELRQRFSRTLSRDLDPEDFRLASMAARAASEDMVRLRLQDLAPSEGMS